MWLSIIILCLCNFHLSVNNGLTLNGSTFIQWFESSQVLPVANSQFYALYDDDDDSDSSSSLLPSGCVWLFGGVRCSDCEYYYCIENDTLITNVDNIDLTNISNPTSTNIGIINNDNRVNQGRKTAVLMDTSSNYYHTLYSIDLETFNTENISSDDSTGYCTALHPSTNNIHSMSREFSSMVTWNWGSNSWIDSSASTMWFHRDGASCIINDYGGTAYMYVFGGDGDSYVTCERSVASSSGSGSGGGWSEVTPSEDNWILEAAGGISLLTYDEYIFVIGGSSGGTFGYYNVLTNKGFDRYDSYYVGTDIPYNLTVLGSAACVIADGRIFVFGGELFGGGYSNKIFYTNQFLYGSGGGDDSGSTTVPYVFTTESGSHTTSQTTIASQTTSQTMEISEAGETTEASQTSQTSQTSTQTSTSTEGITSTVRETKTKGVYSTTVAATTRESVGTSDVGAIVTGDNKSNLVQSWRFGGYGCLIISLCAPIVVFMIGQTYHGNKRFKGCDKPNYSAIFVGFWNMGDFYSDLIFTMLLLFDEDKYIQSLFIYSISAIGLPYFVGNIIALYRIQNWQKYNLYIGHYVNHYDWFIITVSCLAGFYTAIELARSKLFYWRVFSLQLKADDYHQMLNNRLVTTVFMELSGRVYVLWLQLFVVVSKLV